MNVKLPGSELVDAAVDEAIMLLSESPKVDAIGFSGSIAFGMADEKSDVDMICIVNDYMSVEERRELLGKHDYSPIANTIYQEAFMVDGTHIDIQFRERKWFEDVLSNKEMDSDFNEKYVLYMLQNVLPAWDKDGVLKALVERAKYPEDYARRKIELIFTVFKDSCRLMDNLVERGDLLFIDRTFVDLMEKYVAAIFALNRLYFSDVKWGLRKMAGMKVKPADAEKDAKLLGEIGNGPAEIERKMELIRKMILDLAAVVKKSIPSADISGAVEEVKGW